MAEQNQKDTTSLANSVNGAAHTSSLIYEGKRTGKSDQVIVAEVFTDQDMGNFARWLLNSFNQK